MFHATHNTFRFCEENILVVIFVVNRRRVIIKKFLSSTGAVSSRKNFYCQPLPRHHEKILNGRDELQLIVCFLKVAQKNSGRRLEFF